jgi:penicillin-binding protein 1A
LTQQLAKQLFHVKVLNFFAIKAKEWIIAIRLEDNTLKRNTPCIAMYDFGNYSVGVSSAAQTYFSKTPKS